MTEAGEYAIDERKEESRYNNINISFQKSREAAKILRHRKAQAYFREIPYAVFSGH